MLFRKYFHKQQRRWQERVQNETLAWTAERTQFISLLHDGFMEEFFSLIIPYPDMFVSLFAYNSFGNIGFAEDVLIPRTRQLQFAIVLLNSLEESADLLFLFKKGFFDSFFFDVFDRSPPVSDSVRSGLLACSRRMYPIQSGSFLMGVIQEDRDGEQDDNPLRETEIANSYWFSCYPVTQLVWSSIMERNPSIFRSITKPVENVTWFDCISFCNKLSEQEGLPCVYKITGENIIENRNLDGYRLPTEVEWEYAARAGQSTLYSGSDNLDDVGWYKNDDKHSLSHPPAQKRANSWGIYDMSGNVKDWCADPWKAHWEDEVYSEEYQSIRGGAWDDDVDKNRISYRNFFSKRKGHYAIGFRLARTLN